MNGEPLLAFGLEGSAASLRGDGIFACAGFGFAPVSSIRSCASIRCRTVGMPSVLDLAGGEFTDALDEGVAVFAFGEDGQHQRHG